MKKIFQYIILVIATIVVVSCTSDIENTTVKTGKSNILFVVGDFPTFGDSQTRAVGTPDEGKTSWEAGDELLLEVNSHTLGAKYATFTYNGNKWELTNGEPAYKEDEVPSIPHVYYAPNYKWESGKLTLKEGKVPGMDEYIEGTAQITPNGEGITVSFSNATRNYSRLRIATIPNKTITVVTNKFVPAQGSGPVEVTYSLTSNNNGNAFLYGNFEESSSVTVKYEGTSLAAYKFSKATENGKSYALDATVVSLADEAITFEQIGEAVKNEFEAGKTNINLTLAPDADSTVLDAIHYGLAEAGSCSINLTLMGCKKIPSKGFMSWEMLKSIALPDVTEIEENAFSGCAWLQKVVFGNLTKVYGKERKNGIFEGCTTKDIDLVLSKDQKVMNGGDIEGGQYCWTPDNTENYRGSDDHNAIEFLSYKFKSITCE